MDDAVSAAEKDENKMSTNQIKFKTAPELTHASTTYPSDYEHTYQVANYHGATIKKCFINGKLSRVWPYKVESTYYCNVFNTLQEAVSALNSVLGIREVR